MDQATYRVDDQVIVTTPRGHRVLGQVVRIAADPHQPVTVRYRAYGSEFTVSPPRDRVHHAPA